MKDMTNEPQRSGILEWNDENIKNTPSVSGVFVLTNSPTNGTIVDLRCVENLRVSLEERFRLPEPAQPNFFYWYATENIDLAKELYIKLKTHYTSITQ